MQSFFKTFCESLRFNKPFTYENIVKTVEKYYIYLRVFVKSEVSDSNYAKRFGKIADY